ncbi:MAG: ATP-dependent DNA helicase [Candidatus Aenigmatarchaeota archaeon]
MPDFSFFPSEFRDGQKELIEFIQKASGKNICIQASSGFGKTVSILSALLPIAIKENKKIIWTVKTGNETDRPIEELKQINEKTKNSIFGFSYRGKKDMCLLLDAFRDRGGFDYADVSFLCKHSLKECRYFKNFEAIDKGMLADFLSSPMLFSEIREFCERREICPYMLQKEMLKHARLVSINYNYILSEKIGEGISKKIDFADSILVVDEAHNIQQAASNINSSKIFFHALDRVLNEAELFRREEAHQEIKKLVKNLEKFLAKKEKSMKEDEEIVEAQEFIESAGSGISDIASLLNSMKEFGNAIKERQMSDGKAPRSSMGHLSDFISHVMKDAEEEGVILVATKSTGFALEKFDMRCAQLLRERWSLFSSCVFCSGTLNPIEGFCEVAGVEDYAEKTLPSPYSGENAEVFITRGLTTKWDSFNSGMAKKYVSAIKTFLKAHSKNLAVFSSSYRIQNELMQGGLKETIEGLGRKAFIESQDSRGSDAKKLMEDFKRSGGKGVLVATAGGRFAEGADFPGKELEGIFLVGIPFDRISAKTKACIDYYKKLYGSEKGQHYAYVVPAFRRVSQTLGRALRSKDDRAIFVLGDERYSHPRFLRLLPDYIRENAKLVEFLG